MEDIQCQSLASVHVHVSSHTSRNQSGVMVHDACNPNTYLGGRSRNTVSSGTAWLHNKTLSQEEHVLERGKGRRSREEQEG